MITRVLLSVAVAVSVHCAHSASPFRALPKSGEEGDAVFCGIRSASIVKVDAKGRIELTDSGRARLPLHKSDHLDWVWIHVDGTALYVAYEATSRELDGSNGGICKFTPDGRRGLWCTTVPAFNVVAAISGSGALYVAGIGMVGRVRKTDGRYLWKVTGLYKKDHAFNVFRVPMEQGKQVVFFNSEEPKGLATRRLVLDRDSGAILAIDKMPEGTDASSEFVRLVRGCQQ